MHAKKIAVLIAIGLSATQVEAKPPMPYAPSPTELAVLPEACRARLSPQDGQNIFSKAAWEARLGGDVWIHLHHYCHGLKFMNRARATLNRNDRSFNLKAAVGEFNYVLEKWPSGSPMIDEARSKKREAETLLQAR